MNSNCILIKTFFLKDIRSKWSSKKKKKRFLDWRTNQTYDSCRSDFKVFWLKLSLVCSFSDDFIWSDPNLDFLFESSIPLKITNIFHSNGISTLYIHNDDTWNSTEWFISSFVANRWLINSIPLFSIHSIKFALRLSRFFSKNPRAS